MAWQNAEVNHFGIVDKNYSLEVVTFYKQLMQIEELQEVKIKNNRNYRIKNVA